MNRRITSSSGLLLLIPAILLIVFTSGVVQGQMVDFDVSCGDVNADEDIDLADGVWLLRYNLLGGTAPQCEGLYKCADVNKDRHLDIADPVYLLSWLLHGVRSPSCSGIEGCTDEGALNYDPEADTDDGSCAYDDLPVRGFFFAELNEQGQVEYDHIQTGLRFVLVPEDVVRRGSPEEECQRNSDEGPSRDVGMSSFLVAKYELSQRDWIDVMSDNPSFFSPSGKGKPYLTNELLADEGWLDLPVETISWDDCREYCERTGLHMPSEAQWEYACRAGTTTPFAFGDTLSTTDANFWASTGYCGGEIGENLGRTVRVTELTPNNFGIHNVHGNVWEWCADTYVEDAYENIEEGALDPIVDEGEGLRVVRGGGWFGISQYCRSANRSSLRSAVKTMQIGFRPIFNVPQ